jgi:TatA/E family protein of Tat protein translocase
MVLAVAILVFGPKRIPEIAGSLGKGIREFSMSRATPSEPNDRGEPKRLLD